VVPASIGRAADHAAAATRQSSAGGPGRLRLVVGAQ